MTKFNINKPDFSLPVDTDFFKTEDDYITSLLEFATKSHVFDTITSKTHILDFFTRDPDLYATTLPEDWRSWISEIDIYELLDLLLNDDLAKFETAGSQNAPPTSLLDYIRNIRKHCYRTTFDALPTPVYVRKPKIPGVYTPSLLALLSGMNIKKVHEVTHFARFVAGLSDQLEGISHLVDFGCGANYLGRILASPPYGKNVIAIESREHVLEAAKELDTWANLNEEKKRKGAQSTKTSQLPEIEELHIEEEETGKVTYIQARLGSGHLEPYLSPILPSTISPSTPSLLVISLHSCGNLLHHGLRSMTLNPSVAAVAMIGCCYNLTTERFPPFDPGPPSLRTSPSNSELPEGPDPEGFPMSSKFVDYKITSTPGCCAAHSLDREGIRLHTSAKMMAVQAPRNWTREESASFFTRHFYRALLQRIFLDKDIVTIPRPQSLGRSPAGTSSDFKVGTTPIVIGKLPKGAYSDFVKYVRAAVSKMVRSSKGDIVVQPHQTPGAANRPNLLAGTVEEKVGGMTDEEIQDYYDRHIGRKKELCVMWTFMAFSAQVVEAMIVTDRYCWLREQEEVAETWVQTAFDYGMSPRNMVVVGVKKGVTMGWNEKQAEVEQI